MSPRGTLCVVEDGAFLKMKRSELTGGAQCLAVTGGSTAHMASARLSHARGDIATVVISSLGSVLQAIDCKWWGNNYDCLLVHGGAQACLEGCSLTFSMAGFGVHAIGKGTSVSAIDSIMYGNCRSNVLVDGGAQGTLDACIMSGSWERSGLSVAGSSSKAVAHNCKMEGNRRYGVAVLDAGVVAVSDCVLSSALAALWVNGEESSADVRDSTLSSAASYGVEVLGGGSGTLRRCVLTECQAGPGRVSHPSSLLRAVECVLGCGVMQEIDEGVYVTGEAPLVPQPVPGGTHRGWCKQRTESAS